MLGRVENVNEEVERQPGAEEMVTVPSWGTEKQGWGTGTTMAAITKLERGTGIVLKGGSAPRLNLLKICENKETDINIEAKRVRKLA